MSNGKIKALWKNPPKGRYLSIKEMGTFGLYAMGNSCMVASVGYVLTIAFIPLFYQIDQIHAYIIMMLGTVFNLLCQPLIGILMEKSKSKLGRYKPYILFSVPIFAFFGILATWLPQFEIETSRVIYAYLTCVPLQLLVTFANNMYQTMPTVITPVPQERADMMTPIGLMVGFAPSVLQIIAGPIRSHFKDKGMEYMGLRLIGIIGVFIGMAFVMFILKVRERVYVTDEKGKYGDVKLTLGESLRMLTTNKPLMILCIALCVGSLREFTKVFLPLIIQFRFDESATRAIKLGGIPMTIVGFSATVAMVLLPIVTRKMDKHKIIILFNIAGVLAFGFLGFFGFENIPIGTASMVLITGLFFLASINPTYLLVPMMLGEIADYQQEKTGYRLEGQLQTMLFSIPILISQILMIITWRWQTAIGFESKDYALLESLNAEQQSLANEWFNLTGIISAISGILMIIILFAYPLTRKKHAEVCERLKAKSHLDIQNETPEEFSNDDHSDNDNNNNVDDIGTFHNIDLAKSKITLDNDDE